MKAVLNLAQIQKIQSFLGCFHYVTPFHMPIDNRAFFWFSGRLSNNANCRIRFLIPCIKCTFCHDHFFITKVLLQYGSTKRFLTARMFAALITSYGNMPISLGYLGQWKALLYNCYTTTWILFHHHLHTCTILSAPQIKSLMQTQWTCWPVFFCI